MREARAAGKGPRYVERVEQTIELKNGGKISVERKGTMTHVDAAGNRVRMRDGLAMEAKDGSRYMMKNNAIWKQITEQGTLNPKM